MQVGLHHKLHWKKKETGPGYKNWYGWMTAVTKCYAQLGTVSTAGGGKRCR